MFGGSSGGGDGCVRACVYLYVCVCARTHTILDREVKTMELPKEYNVF